MVCTVKNYIYNREKYIEIIKHNEFKNQSKDGMENIKCKKKWFGCVYFTPPGRCEITDFSHRGGVKSLLFHTVPLGAVWKGCYFTPSPMGRCEKAVISHRPFWTFNNMILGFQHLFASFTVSIVPLNIFWKLPLIPSCLFYF